LLSVGALLEKNQMLEAAFTTTRDSDVQRNKFALVALLGNSVRDSRPLRKMIGHYLCDDILEELAEVARREHRRAYVASVNLDSGLLTIWDVSAIALDGNYELCRDVVYASASAPILYPPVNIGGHLHVDGGARAQLFFRGYLQPAIEDVKRKARAGPGAPPAPPEPTVHVIVNGSLRMAADCPANSLLPIAKRTISSLLNANAIGDIYLTRFFADQLAYQMKVAGIPEDVAEVDSFTFEPAKMRKLFDAGVEHGRQNYWDNGLPRSMPPSVR
jgi:hypothetical protein